MSLNISISPASDIPIFRQIVQQIQRGVVRGQLQVGDQLPAVRTLAETLVLNPNTIARAYQELIRDGLLESRSGRGVFIAERRLVFSEAERARRLEHAAEQLGHEAILLGSTLPEIQDILARKWQELNTESHSIPTSRKRKSS